MFLSRKIFVGAVTVIFLLANTAAGAFAAQIKKIDLEDAIQLSLSNNLDLQSQRIDVELAKNSVKIANRLQNPEFNFFYNLGTAGRSEPQQIGLRDVVELGKRSPRKKLAKSELYKKEIEVKMSEFTLEMDVRETYVDLVCAKTILNDLKEQQTVLEELSRAAQKRFESGKTSQTDVLQAQIALNKLAAKVNIARSALQAARNDFNKALNIKEDSDVIYDTKEDMLPGETVFIALKTPDFNTKLPEFDKIAAKALEKRLDIKAAKQEIDIAQKNLTVVSRQKVPNLELAGGYSFLPSSHADSGKYESGAYIGASLMNLPLLYSYKPEIKNAKLQIEQAQIKYESAKNKALKDLNTAYERLLTSQANLIFYKNKLVKDSEELIKISKKNYQDGKADLTSVIVMEESYREILAGYDAALADYYTDWIDFLREVNAEDFNLFDENL